MAGKRSNRILIAGAATLGLLLLLVLAGSNLRQQQEYRTSQGYSGAARYNRLHAAELLLRELGVDARSIAGMPEPESLLGGDVLIMLAPTFTLGSDYVERLLDWVERGGVLIFQTRESNDRDDADGEPSDPLQSALGLMVEKNDFEAGSYSVHSIVIGGSAYQLRWRQLYRMIDADNWASWRHLDDQLPLMLGYDYGAGSVLAMADLGLFFNDRIGERDHADALRHLLQVLEGTGTHWLQYSPEVPSLLELIWRHAWPLLLGLMLTVAAIIWTGGQRLGPLQLEPPSAQRSLLEHLRASGRFLWRNDDSGALLSAARQRTLQAVRRRHPQWQSLDRERRLDHIAAVSGLQREQVEDALHRDPKGSGGFLRTIRTLRHIEKHS